MKRPYKIFKAKGSPVPIIISIPHSGTKIPKRLQRNFKSEMLRVKDDTDWFVHLLYDFAPDMGITMIKAKYHRWVIDLNRNPKSQPLYDDGRLTTGLVPDTDFFNFKLLKSDQHRPDNQELDRRLNKIYQPYYDKVHSLLAACKSQFGRALLWDAHSIRALVPSIYSEKFPDMILGDNDETSASPEIIASAFSGLQSGRYQVAHNMPFKGGNITRHFGDPQKNVHALQLEMTKLLYMDEREILFQKEKADQVKQVLKSTLLDLIKTLSKL